MSGSEDAADARQVPVDDRGFGYGDGLFETMAVTAGRVLGLDAHLRRLKRGCEVLGFEPPSHEVLVQALAEAAAGEGRAILKLMLTRGSGGRGYAPPSPAEPRLRVRRHPWPADITAQRTDGIDVVQLAARLGENPALAGIKHLNRLEQVLAAAELARRPPAQEGVMHDQSGRVVCGVMSNLFLVLHGVLVTPCLERCGIAGIIRESLLTLSRQGQFEPVAVRPVPASDLDGVDEMFLTNSVRGVLPVRSLDGRALLAPGPRARAAWQVLEAQGLVA